MQQFPVRMLDVPMPSRCDLETVQQRPTCCAAIHTLGSGGRPARTCYTALIDFSTAYTTTLMLARPVGVRHAADRKKHRNTYADLQAYTADSLSDSRRRLLFALSGAGRRRKAP